ncbi:MAG: hypothetical protein EBX52_03530 [Proteobacteria bacterium]|nr:hypothetical protein [Pseudomonadota bacterium]
MMRAQKVLGMAALVLISSTLGACSKKNILASLDLGITHVGPETDLRLASTVHLGNMSLAGLDIPITAPGSNLHLGSVSLGTAPDGTQQIALSLNATAFLHADPIAGSTLPNGRALPSAIDPGPAGTLLALPILNSSRVYLGGDLKTRIVLGVALTLPALDPVTANLPLSANAFFKRTFSSLISGVAGLYSSPQAHQSGIAVFGVLTPSRAGGTSPSLSLQQKSTPARRPASAPDSLSGQDQLRILQFFTGSPRVLSVD